MDGSQKRFRSSTSAARVIDILLGKTDPKRLPDLCPDFDRRAHVGVNRTCAGTCAAGDADMKRDRHFAFPFDVDGGDEVDEPGLHGSYPVAEYSFRRSSKNKCWQVSRLAEQDSSNP